MAIWLYHSSKFMVESLNEASNTMIKVIPKARKPHLAESIIILMSIHQYLALAKNGTEKSLPTIVDQCLNHPNVYLFGELLVLPNVQALKTSSDSSAKAAI